MDESVEKFLEVRDKHKPSPTLIWLNNFAINLLLPTKISFIISFIAGFVLVFVNVEWVKYTAVGYTPLVILALTTLIVVQLNNARIRKICRECDITINQYKFMTEAYT